MMKSTICIILLAAGHYSVSAQMLFNGDLEGDIPTEGSELPLGWKFVHAGDPNCYAAGPACATPDLTGINGPYPQNGIYGTPQSGNTFISGLASECHHEGIKQTVSGFQPGKCYFVSFYQSVVKQKNVDHLDTSGGWSVCLDDQVIFVSEITHSLDSACHPDLKWDYRVLMFTATSEQHTLKFLPADDDSDKGTFQSLSGGLRMGIDNISLYSQYPDNISTCSCTEIVVFPNPAYGEIQVFGVYSGYMEIYALDGKLLYRLETRSVIDLPPLSHGLYLLIFRNETDEILKIVKQEIF